MKNQIIVTIGPSSLKADILKSLRDAGASDFRINLSHSNLHHLREYYTKMQDVGITPSIDTQGAQLRIVEINTNETLELDCIIELYFGKDIKTDPQKQFLRINHPEAAEQIEEGDIFKVDFGGLALQILEKNSSHHFSAKVIATGSVVLNRAVDIKNKNIKLNPFTIFDKQAIEFAINKGCSKIYLSFASQTSDVMQLRKLAPTVKIISKIESINGLNNLRSILEVSDAILIDRGDLSREISIPMVPLAVNEIIKISKEYNKEVYVATIVLDSMMTSPVPSRAEISDLFNLLERGIAGIVLAAEVAIGENPIASVSLINYIMKIFDQHADGLWGISALQKPELELIGRELHQWL